MRTTLFACLTAICLAFAVPVGAQEINGRFLLDTFDGKRVTDEAYRGKVRMMTFGYTFCPDICPTTLTTMAAALDLLGPDRDKVAALFVTIDPERDTMSHLKEYLSAFPGVVGLTGTVGMVDMAARNFKVRYQRHLPTGGDPEVYPVDHSAGVWVMGRNGAFVARLGHAATPNEVAARIREALQ